ncbi:MAG: hypothetical protein LDLANPLL_00467 [Turneriella sp.]|nr:hypothetical protein [Turneriella sp.]
MNERKHNIKGMVNRAIYRYTGLVSLVALMSCSSMVRRPEFVPLENQFIFDRANNLVWQKCVIGTDPVRCTGDSSLLTYQEAKAACNAISYEGKKFRLPKRNEAYWSLVTCGGGSFDFRVEKTTAGLSERQLSMILQKPGLTEESISSCTKPEAKFNGEENFPGLRDKNIIWTSTFAYSLIYSDTCLGNSQDRCAVMPQSWLTESVVKERSEEYFLGLRISTGEDVRLVAKPTSLPQAQPAARANVLCVVEMEKK